MKIDLCWLSRENQPPDWPLGKVVVCPPEARVLSESLLQNLPSTDADTWLFWDAQLPLPSFALLEELQAQRCEVWHAGLLLGHAGQPVFIDYVTPTWMLNRDPDAMIEATSWRLSLRACMIRTEVLRQMGGPLPVFDTLESASLEMGYRYIRNGVFVRQCPQLLQYQLLHPPGKLPVQDQLRFIAACFGKKWLYWAVFRGVMNKTLSLHILLPSLRIAHKSLRTSPVLPYSRGEDRKPLPLSSPNVGVLIPTVNRYPYLRTMLTQLRTQTVKPLEVLVIDQTPAEARDAEILQQFKDLPLKWFTLDKTGQCSSRNLGLREARGDYILFLDDDDEIPDTLIESHLESITLHSTNISNGIALETGMEVVPKGFTFTRLSDVFPTNNTMIRKHVLSISGLFDLAYDHGQRADHDLGMRVYLSGEKMVLEPKNSVVHHHAPQGGLREHKARVTTRTVSRKSLWLRVIPSPSDIYLAKRYFSALQVREMLWISIFETFSLDGPAWKKALKGLISLFATPLTLIKLKDNVNKANLLLLGYPQIPGLDE